MAKPVRFRISIADPHTRRLRVEMTVRGLEDTASVDLHLPVWTPGSYLVREYSQFVKLITARDQDGDRRDATKQDKATWRVESATAREITVVYEVYAHTLNVRYNHVEDDHAFLHGPALFMYPSGRLEDEVELHLDVPEHWRVWTGLRRPEAAHDYFEASSFDELYDCPLLCGDLESFEFEAAGTPHRYVMWGRGNYDPDWVADDTRRIVEASAEIFGGGVPYEDFSFLTLLTKDQFGGLEHRNSTALMYPRSEFRDASTDERYDDKYLNFLTLVAHEHFHVWNVKRIRPERLGPFDYQNENYTRDLWTVEGITSYYQWVSLLRAGLIDGAKFLESLGKWIKALHEIPGRNASSLEDASFDTWIRLYRPHPDNLNTNVSYYLKGGLAAMALDVMIRVDTDGERSLDDVMRHLWTHYSAEAGYPEGSYESIVREVVGNDVSEFFDVFITGTEDPDWNDWFENIGLQVSSEVGEDASPFFGFHHKDGEIKQVAVGSPAEAGGLQPDDVVVALDHFEVTSLDDRLKHATPGTPVVFHLFRRGELIERTVVPAEPRATKVQFSVRDDADERALELLREWIGTTDLGSDAESKSEDP